ncbi:CbtA family protein [Pseudoxanthobacter sp. M-2]|uniref:CbtA family protein n=1 Tax=Pseudoxanthobacter sp. M-2 TaxID=3078754 RepID=UPI0038FCE25B
MLGRILSVGLLAGLAVGLAIAVLQHFSVTPLILHAESFEHAGEAAHSGVLHDFGDAKLMLAHSVAEHADGEEGWAPEDGLERTAFTALATLLAGVGFALMLTAAMVASGETISERTGLAWGAAAFVAVVLAPAFGLPPELPASAAAGLDARQLWWVVTVAMTAVALFLFLKVDRPWAKPLAVVLALAPQIVGAPQPAEFTSAVPAELQGEFAARSIVLSGLFWLAIGWAVGALWPRFAARTAP